MSLQTDALPGHDAADPGPGDRRSGHRRASRPRRSRWRSPTRSSTSGSLPMSSRTGIAGYFSENFVVRADGPIKKIEDVKGKRVATNAIGSAQRRRDADDAAQARHQGQRFHDGRDQFRQHAGDARRRQSRPDRRSCRNSPRASSATPNTGCCSPARDAVGPTQAVMWAMRGRRDRGAPAGSGRFLRGPYPRGALVPRPEEPRGGARHRRCRDQAAEGGPRLRLHQGGFLPLARCAPGARHGAAARSTRRSNSACCRNAVADRARNTSICR